MECLDHCNKILLAKLLQKGGRLSKRHRVRDDTYSRDFIYELDDLFEEEAEKQRLRIENARLQEALAVEKRRCRLQRLFYRPKWNFCDGFIRNVLAKLINSPLNSFYWYFVFPDCLIIIAESLMTSISKNAKTKVDIMPLQLVLFSIL